MVDGTAMKTRNAGGSGLGMVKKKNSGVAWGGQGDSSWKENIFLLIKIIYIHIIKTMKYQRTYDEKLVSCSKPNFSMETLVISGSYKSKHLCL